MRRRLCVALVICVCVFGFGQHALAQEAPPETALVWVADISSSLPEIDPLRYWSDAVSLGVDLTPANTQTAFIAVNDAVTAQTPLLDMAKADNRSDIKKAARDAAIEGYTDFSVGLSAALTLLESTSAKDKYIFLVADSYESGFMFRTGKYDNVSGDMDTLTKLLSDSGVKVYLLFLREPARNHEFMPLWRDLVALTGGELINIDDPSKLPKAVETAYFEAFNYNKSLTFGVNTSDLAQDIPIRLPDFGLERARIYISSDTPMRGMQARADGTELSFSDNRSYFMLDLAPPLPETVTLTLPPNEAKDVRVYLLADGNLSLTTAVDNGEEKDEAANVYRQKTTVTFTPLESGAPLFQAASQPNAVWTLTMTDPDGKTADVDATYANGSFEYVFYPDRFGTYTFAMTITSQGIRLTADADAEVSAMDLSVIPDEPPSPAPDYSLWIAIAIGAFLILAAILFAHFRRRRGRTTGSAPISVPLPIAAATPTAARAAARSRRRHKRSGKAVPIPEPLVFPADMPAGEPVFTGKLDIYGVLVEGGRAEIPATSFLLGDMWERGSISLALVLEQSGVPYRYPSASHIHLSPGPYYTLVIKNNSGAAVYCGGQPWLRGQQAVLTYGQKMRVVFEEDVSEYEIFYHKAVQMAISGDHIHMELQNQSYT